MYQRYQLMDTIHEFELHAGTTLLTDPITASALSLRPRSGGKSLRESATYTDEFGAFVCKKFADQAGLLPVWALENLIISLRGLD